MTLDEFQKSTERTAGKDSLAVLTLGLAGEAGEVADLIKKYIGHGHSLDKSMLMDELGDCLWYIARIAATRDITLNDVAESNIQKLQKRYPKGFSNAASINRTDWLNEPPDDQLKAAACGV
jgi:NTP pyrophosphatase (non-canonical NTP hydrolase)